MLASAYTYASLLVIVLLIVALGVLLLGRQAMGAGIPFEGSIGNRFLSMKIRTTPLLREEPAADKLREVTPISPVDLRAEAQSGGP